MTPAKGPGAVPLKQVVRTIEKKIQRGVDLRALLQLDLSDVLEIDGPKVDDDGASNKPGPKKSKSETRERS
jgi:FtsZ-binding cell division protein ZapB